MPRKPDVSYPSSQAWLVKNRASVSFEVKDGANHVTVQTSSLSLSGYDLIDVVARAIKIEEARKFRAERESAEATYSQVMPWVKDFT